MDLFQLTARLSMDTSEFERGVNKSRGIFEKLGSTVSASTVAMGNLMSDAVKKGAQMVTNLGKLGISYNAQMEDYTASFRTMLGSTEAATAKVEALKEFAAKTPFEMTDLASATQTLLAFGVEAEKTDSIMKMLGDVSLGNSQKFSSLALAFGQVSSTGKLMGQDLLQMINSGFNPLQVIAEKTGASMGDLKKVMSGEKTSKDFQKMIKAARAEVKKMGDAASESAKLLAQIGEDGQISAEMVEEAFWIATSEGGRFFNGMEENSKTLNGLFSTLKDNWTSLVGDVFKPASDFLQTTLLPLAISAVDELSKAYEQTGLEGMIHAAGRVLEDLMESFRKSAPRGIVAFLDGIKGAFSWFTENEDLVKGALTGIATALFSVAFVSHPLLTIISGIVGLFTQLASTESGAGWLAANAEKISAAFVLIGTGIGVIAAYLHPVIAGIALIGIALVDLVENKDKYFTKMVEWFASIGTSIKEAVMGFGEFVLIEVPSTFSDAISEIAGWFDGIAASLGLSKADIETFVKTKIPPEFLVAVGKVVLFFESIATSLSNALTDIGKFVATNVPQPLLDALGTLKGIWDGIASAIKSAYEYVEKFFGAGGGKFGGGNSLGGGGGMDIPGSEPGWSDAVGRKFVPYDGYWTSLHRGEAVLNRSEAEEWRAGKGGNGTTIVVNQYISSEAQTAAELMREARWEQERGVLMGYAYV